VFTARYGLGLYIKRSAIRLQRVNKLFQIHEFEHNINLSTSVNVSRNTTLPF
jgi:hypothetical protein